MPKNKTKKNAELDQSWALLVARHSKPLEKGAKARGLCVQVQTPAKSQVPDATSRSRQEVFEGMRGAGAPRVQQMYTGNAVVGVATMHKSNSVPVFNADAARDVAQMRRN